ncbi:MAG: ribosome-recycling factor [Candidatus Marinimicrobia bacterium]|nr:ribosome-recycling factor [Candidatus Neomarinimicrobiota bacterium]
MYNFLNFKDKAKETEEWFKNEIALIRTGRANPSLIENIKVDYYGTKNQLKGMASISVENAQTLIVRPWDTDAIMPIEQAISGSNIGVQAIGEKGAVRVILPELSEERRISLLKLLSDKLEESKISLRKKREEVWRDIQDKEKSGEFSEDEKFRYKDELQKMVDGAIETLDKVSAQKETEIKN